MWLAGRESEWLEMTLEKLVRKTVQDFVSYNKEFSVFGNPLKSFMQESSMIIFMFDNRFSCFCRHECNITRRFLGKFRLGMMGNVLEGGGDGFGKEDRVKTHLGSILRDTY